MRESEKHEAVSLTELRDELIKKDKGNGYVKDELCFLCPLVIGSLKWETL